MANIMLCYTVCLRRNLCYSSDTSMAVSKVVSVEINLAKLRISTGMLFSDDLMQEKRRKQGVFFAT